jgi:hypothetical protein
MSEKLQLVLTDDFPDVVLSEGTPANSVVLELSQFFVGPVGPQGPKGTMSTATFIFSSAQSSWSIAHNQGRYPSVTCVDSFGSRFEGELQYVDANNILLTFAMPVVGKAYIN